MLSVVHEDALKAKPPALASFEGLEPELRADHALLKADERFGLSGQLDPEKQAAFTRIREGGFDLVIGNPPYVAEANNKPLFERLRQIDAWKGVYRGKSDYYYYFLLMAAELVAPGGRLCVIVPAGWMNAGNADWLRENLAETLRLDELFLFGSYRLFGPEREAALHHAHRAPTPTVESAILVATKMKAPKGHKMRVVALEDEAALSRAHGENGETTIPDRAELLAEMAARAGERQGRKGGLHVHDVQQGDLVADRPWSVKQGSRDVGPRIVARLQALLDQAGTGIEPLAAGGLVVRGIETAADAYTLRVQKRLRDSFPKALAKLEKGTAAIGDPILELPAGSERSQPWSENPDVLAKSIEPGAILYGAVDQDDYTHLVWLDSRDSPNREVLSALEEWKPLLEVRAGNLEVPDKPWWTTHRPRDKSTLRRPKVIALYRTHRGRFAADVDGEWHPSNKTTLFIPHEDSGSVLYVCGLLNSELLDLWYSIRGKTPRDIWRNYEPKRMKEIPYRSVKMSVEIDTRRLHKLETALRNRDAERAGLLAKQMGADLRGSKDAGLIADAPEAVEAARALEGIVRAIADNRRALLPFRDRFPELARVVKDPWSVEVVDPDARAFASSWPKKKRASVRVDPDLKTEVKTDGALGSAKLEGDSLVFRYRRQEVARVAGPLDKLLLLSEVLAATGRLGPAEFKAIELPRDVADFRAAVEAATVEVAALLAEGRVLVEAAERLVCALYAIPAELEDEVVAHAVARATAIPAAA